MLNYIIFLCATLQSVFPLNISVTLPINKTTTQGNKELIGGYYYLNTTSTLEFNFEGVNKNISFIIFQVHSHIYNVTLYNNTMIKGSYVTGTNVGLYSKVAPKMDTFLVYNPNNIGLKLYVSVHGYQQTDPIPGGCNMEFPVPISPFMRSSFNKDYLTVDATFPKEPKDIDCVTIDRTTVVFYKLYLSERDFSTDTYFEGIRNMMTMDGIADYGQYVSANGLHMRRMLSAYPGTGSIYVAVAFSNINPDAYAVYVPTSSYACDPLDFSSCTNLDDVFSNILCTSLIFVGLFMCYLGHRFFKTEMFLVGLISGVFITFVLISIIADLNRPALLGASILSGLCFGAIWLCFWWFYGIPVFSVFLPTLNLGFLFASILYFSLPGGINILLVDFSFWTMFIFVMLITSLIIISPTYHTNIACCAILGAYAFIYPIDHYLGSNLKYIVINTVRRAVVPNFNKAVTSPPFEWRDASLCVIWAAVAVSGFLLQRHHNGGRPPFPPPPRSIRPEAPSSMYGSADVARRNYQYIYPVPSTSQYSERTPLLSTEA